MQGMSQELDDEDFDNFFSKFDKDGSGQVEKKEMGKFLQMLTGGPKKKKVKKKAAGGAQK